MTVIVKEQYLPNTVFITFVVLSQSFDCIGITDISNKGNNKLPNSDQSYKGKVKTHNYIN